MNVYDSERMTESAGPARLCRDAGDGGRRSRRPQHLPHPREGRREGLFRPRPHPQAEGAARGAGKDTIVTVAGCVAQAEGAEIARRAPVVDIVVGPQSYHRLGELVARTRPEHAASSRPAFPRRTSLPRCPSARPASAGGVPHRAGGLRQVLHVLRRALHARRRVFAPRRRRRGGGAPPRSHGVREMTLLGQNVNAYHGAGPDGRAWSLARLIDRLARHRGHRAPALHDQPSARHDRRSDRGARRRAQADALSCTCRFSRAPTASWPP